MTIVNSMVIKYIYLIKKTLLFIAGFTRLHNYLELILFGNYIRDLWTCYAESEPFIIKSLKILTAVVYVPYSKFNGGRKSKKR